MTGGRVPPHDRDAEQALIGAMLIAGHAIDAAAPIVTPEDFYVPSHSHAYAAALTLRAAGQPVDAVTVAHQLAEAGYATLTVADLTALTADTPATSNAARYARIVAALATRRRLIGLAGEIAEAGYDPGCDLAQALEQAGDEVRRLAAGSTARRPVTLNEALDRWAANEHTWQQTGTLEHGQPVATGLADIDHKLAGGWRPGQLIVVAARPAMGKSGFCAQTAVAAATAGVPALFVSLEMSADDVAQRILGSASRVNLQRLRTHDLQPADWPRLAGAIGTLAAAPLHILDDGAASLTTIAAWAKQLRGVGLVVVDYLALVRPAAGRRHEGRQFEVAEIARGLKTLAMELQVPVIAAAQLNRAVEHRISDRRPTLADLRDSGEVEQAADVVIGLYRDDYYNPESADRGIAELIVLKQRNGPTGTVKVAWLEHHGRFELMRRV